MVFLCLVSLADIKSQYECDKEQWTCTQDDCLNRNCTCSNNGVCKQMCPDTRKWTPFNVCPKMACTAEEQCAQLADRKTNIMDGKSKVVTQVGYTPVYYMTNSYRPGIKKFDWLKAGL